MFIIKGVAQNENRPVAKPRPANYEYLAAPDSNGIRVALKMPQTERNQSQLLPYPIIFVHGLNSNSATWDSTTMWMDSVYGFAFGGRFDFCLNYDADETKANKRFNTTDADMALFQGTIVPGDYYTVNYDVDTTGAFHPSYWSSAFVESNQSAIAKQGYALKWAIEKVLQVTGREKVILMGHSMGGLASREYLQNVYNWQDDGQTHVAKLTTTGTPHGGSNSTAYHLGFVVGMDEQSEAVRDLRRTFYYSLDSGVFLYGGLELQDDSTHMYDSYFSDFNNVDVNCNGIDSDMVVGLNHKPLGTDLEYTCIIGLCDGCLNEDNDTIGDGVVNAYCANLSNYYPSVPIHKFYYNAAAYTEIHTSLPSQNNLNIIGLDEPASFQHAYKVDIGNSYLGFITEQAEMPYYYDYDSYYFEMPANGLFSLHISNFVLPQFSMNLFDSLFNSMGVITQQLGDTAIDYNQHLPAGKYYLRISAIAGQLSYLYPYKFSLNAIIDDPTSVQEIKLLDDALVYPNPMNDNLYVRLGNNSLNFTAEIINAVGVSVVSEKGNGGAVNISTAGLASGLYTLKLDAGKGAVIKKLIKS